VVYRSSVASVVLDPAASLGLQSIVRDTLGKGDLA
jgi:hypothetical protein